MGLFRRKKVSSRRGVAQQGRSASFTYYQNREDSVRSKRDISKPQRAEEQRGSSNRFALHHLPTYLAVLVIIASFVYAMTLSTAPKVIVVNEQNEAVQSFLRPTEVYQQAAEAELKSSPFNKTKITLNTDAVAAKLQEEFPEATDVAVTLPLIARRPVIYMRIAEPVLLLKGPSGSYVVDEKGRAVVLLEEAPNAQNLSLLPIDDQTGLDLQAGQQALPKNHIEFITEVKNQFDANGLKVTSMTLPPLANELHVHIDGVPYLIKFNFVNDPRKQVGSYLAVKQKLDQDKVTPAEYVDVRVEERAYYK